MEQASPIPVPQYCRTGQFMTNSGIFVSGSSPSWGTVHAWIEDKHLPVKRIGKTIFIDMKALFQRLERQARVNGFRYVMEETQLVKLSLFPKGTDLFESSSCPCRRTVYNWEKKAADLSTSGRRGSACKGNIHPLINIVAVAPFLIIHSKTLALEFTLYVEFTDKVNFEYRVNLCCAYKADQVEESYGVKAEGISYFYRK